MKKNRNQMWYRWNPIFNRWEYCWGESSRPMWFASAAYRQNKETEIPKDYLRNNNLDIISYAETWCEPYEGMENE